MTISELLKSMIDSSKDRIKTPIVGAYFFSFFIWNWRPILLLMFEKTTITNKIILINDEYCNAMSIIGPLLMALFFTLGVPYISVAINQLLIKVNDSRVDGAYSIKFKLAIKELQLQDIRSRSKEKEDFLKKIDELESKLKSDEDSHILVVQTLIDENNKIKELLELQNQKIILPNIALLTKSDQELWKLISNSELNLKDISKLKNIIDVNTSLSMDYYSRKVFDWLLNNNLIESNGDGYSPTPNGVRLKKMIHFN